MKVLAVDPGYERMGIAVIELVGNNEILLFSTCLQSNKEDPLSKRILSLGLEFLKIAKIHKPDTVAIENLFFNTNQKTAVAVAQARGAILFLSEQMGCGVYEFGPQEIKVAVTGYGKSDKSAVIDMVKRLVKNVPENALDDEYDAIAVGITCLAHHGRSVYNPQLM